ncbi:MAG TPA: translocation/assembly module TamB domain-containing protein [Chitinophagaceae bacterium]|nr:translocation/assembly module TamB domain-containing protein [Chitinophagaceae bacterium]
MSNEATIPSSQPKSVCTFKVLSGGAQVPGTWHVLSIVVNKEVNRIPTATIILIDGDPAAQSFEVSNAAEFEPGKEIEIQAGWRNDDETIFKGIAIKQGIKVRNSASILIVECRDKAVKMTISAKSKYFKDTTDSSIMEELIDKYGIEKDVEATTLTHKEVVQYNATDWDFMLCRADVNGKLCVASDGKIKIAKPDLGAASVLTVQYGATVLDLDMEIDSRTQLKGVKAASWNPADQELADSIEAAEPSVPESGNLGAGKLSEVMNDDPFTLVHSGKIAEPEMQQWADAKLLKNRLAKIRGKVRIDGFAGIKPGDMFQLNGVGERFEGKLFVSGVRQQIEGGDWNTVIQFGMLPEWFAETYKVEQPMAGAMLPAIQGLHIGTVTKLEGDPDGEDRIMVRVPVIHKEDEGIWSRIATLDAGNERGTFFRPEIEDEVVVGFLNNDPRHAIVLGQCNSSAKPAPQPPSDDNHEKGYQSRSKMKMIFNDDKKTFTLETPAGNKFIITEDEKAIKMEDQHGNKFTMNEEGIKLESIKDIVLKATNNVNVEGVNVEGKASGNMTMKGSGAAEFSASGQTTLKGGTVMIN